MTGRSRQDPSLPVERADAALVARALTEAFAGDPLMAWIFDDPRTHVASLGVWWRHIADAATASGTGHLWLLGTGAAAIWYPPALGNADAGDTDDTDAGTSDTGGGTIDTDEQEANAFVEMVAGLVGPRLGEVLDAFRAIQEAHPEEAHWYLAAVGTTPSLQGRGLGARLLAPVLDRCDHDGLPAYLESSSPRNVPFYLRLGFEITGELHVGDDPVVLTTMWRRPG